MKRRTIERLVIAFWFVAICVVFAERANRPPAAVPASAPQTAFSAERAMKHVFAIAKRPHPVGSADHDRVRDYLIAQLGTLGLEAQVQHATGVGTRYADAGRVQGIPTVVDRLIQQATPGTVRNTRTASRFPGPVSNIKERARFGRDVVLGGAAPVASLRPDA